MDYTKFSVEDLASDDSFLGWVNRNDPEAEKFWELFISVHPEMKLKIDQARALVSNVRRADARPDNEKQIDAIWGAIEYRITESEKTSPAYRRNTIIHYSAAAVITGMLALAIGYMFFHDVQHRDTDFKAHFETRVENFVEEVNTTGKTLRLHLSDGSIVDLEHGSRLKYKRSYEGAASRQVYLLGEAFFTVAKNPRQPFLVHSNEVVTRAIGTSFRVKALDDERHVIVSVKTGKVSVYAVKEPGAVAPEAEDVDSEKSGVILLPNQQVTYQREQESFDKALVALPDVVLPSLEESDFIFDSTPIAEVFKVLERAYGIEIIFEKEIMGNCFVTAPLGSEPLFDKLRIICRTIGASYEVIDAKVIINSAGC